MAPAPIARIVRPYQRWKNQIGMPHIGAEKGSRRDREACVRLSASSAIVPPIECARIDPCLRRAAFDLREAAHQRIDIPVEILDVAGQRILQRAL
jgi:hypothetical protein